MSQVYPMVSNAWFWAPKSVRWDDLFLSNSASHVCLISSHLILSHPNSTTKSRWYPWQIYLNLIPSPSLDIPCMRNSGPIYILSADETNTSWSHHVSQVHLISLNGYPTGLIHGIRWDNNCKRWDIGWDKVHSQSVNIDTVFQEETAVSKFMCKTVLMPNSNARSRKVAHWQMASWLRTKYWIYRRGQKFCFLAQLQVSSFAVVQRQWRLTGRSRSPHHQSDQYSRPPGMSF